MKLEQKVWLLLVATTLAILFIVPSSKADEPTLGSPEYSDTGCPDGSVDFALSPGATAISLMFSQFETRSGGSTQKPFDRKTCKIKIPVRVPRGMSVAITQADFRGYNSIPARGLANLTVQFWLGHGGTLSSTPIGGSMPPRILKRFVGPVAEEFLAVNKLRQEDVRFSKCNVDNEVTLNMVVSLLSQSNNLKDEAMGSIDSQDLSGGPSGNKRESMIYQLQWKNCP